MMTGHCSRSPVHVRTMAATGRPCHDDTIDDGRWMMMDGRLADDTGSTGRHPCPSVIHMDGGWTPDGWWMMDDG